MRVSKSVGVRKGAWTQDEDILLRKCIEKYGEGKWHQVPLKAGLNRCRKSCRLRWLNYLKPDIKRGEFAVDEVDLIVRLHKLLGNRYVQSVCDSGRIPGRTANDVKNYWNTHMQKKIAAPKEKPKPKDNETTLIKPRARTFSRNLYSSTGVLKSSTNNNPSKENNFSQSPQELPPVDDGSQWWSDLFDDKEEDAGGDGWCFGGSDERDEQSAEAFFAQQTLGDDSVQEGPNAWSDFSIDLDIWHLLNSDQALM